jgi:NADPH2:quinone reductase
VRALQITDLSGPDALTLAEVADPPPVHPMSPGEGVVVEVRAAGVSFPDVLQTRGLYQYKPDLPFVPGAEVAGIVTAATPGSGFTPGDRVAAFTMIGGMAELAVAPPFLTFPLPEALDYAQGASLILNYHTVLFALRIRGRLSKGERVLVHGAAGGVGSAALQVARALGARTIALVSSDAKADVAHAAGADEVVRVDGPWREEVQQLTGDGVDLVIDPVGGDRLLDSLRCLRENGRHVVVGFTAGSIPEVKVNRLLLRNIDVVGAGWGAYAMTKPDLCRDLGMELDRMIAAGSVRPIVGARFPLAQGAEAFKLIDERGATGKVVLDVPGD